MRTGKLSTALALLLALVGPFFVSGDRLGAASPATPVTLVALDAPYTQNFDTLASSGTSGTVPTGWGFEETGTNNNATYTAGTGSGNTGDTYSFGAAASTERALGGPLSGSLVPTVGARFTNSTGGTITSLDIAYTGEQWRLGTSGRGSDRLDFQISTDATSLTIGTYSDVNALDFSGPINVGTVGPLNGNSAANRTSVSSTITGLSIPSGATFYIRWTDFNATGADDGLAIDDFSLTPHGVAVVPTNPTGVGSANPSSVAPGATTLLTVVVAPGTSPTSTGLAVAADLTSIGGPATQAFFDNGTLGDVAAGDNIFSYQATVGALISSGSKSLAVNISDAQARVGNTSIALTVLPAFRAIHTIQGSGTVSPFAGSAVRTSGIVTGRKSNGFFLQTPDFEADADPATSEGIFVFTSAAPPAAAAIGNAVEVSGIVQEFVPSADPSSPPATEIAGGPTVTFVSSGNTLPTPITLTAADASPGGAIEQLERFEGMRVFVASLTIVAPTGGFISEATATSTSDGVFYGVIPGIARPFREPGIEVPDPLPAGSPCCVPRFDGNAERLRVDSDAQPGTVALDVPVGATVTNLVGPLDYASRTYTILPDLATPPVASGDLIAPPVPAPTGGQFTIASFNMERFFDTVNDPGISDVALTATAFNNRLNKASLAIRNILRTPDIIGVQEMENLTTLQTLADRINNDAMAAGDPNPDYHAYLEEGNDIGGIDVGFLAKWSRVAVLSVTQEGKAATYTDPNTGLQAMLNDRPPLVLLASIMPPSGMPYPITVVNNHLRSLSGVDDPADGNRVRTKRRAQAEFLANLIQTRQTADPTERIISVGDYNAFQFSDGYVDSIGTIKGTPTDATQVVLVSADLVNPNLVDLVELAPASQRYSFVFGGNAQELDHLLITGNLLTRFVALNYGRMDADFPEVYRGDATRPERISDHDPSVAYFSFPAADLTVAKTAPSPVLTGSTLGYTITVENTLTDPAYAVVVSDQVPPGTSFASIDAPAGWTCSGPGGGGTIVCSAASLGAGATATFTLNVGVTCSLPNATAIANTVTVASDTFDPDPSNNAATSTVTTSNPAPIVMAPADAVYQLLSEVPAANPSDASVSDNCGTPTVAVAESNNGGAGSPASPLVITRVYTATDSAGNSSSATQTITVIDSTPPVVAGLSVDKASLWPPNHKMQLVTMTYAATDNGGAVAVVISVSSNEPQNGLGDGDTATDWEVVDATHVRLRAERSGQGSGRTYTIHVVATDAAGNTTIADVAVTVPHSK